MPQDNITPPPGFTLDTNSTEVKPPTGFVLDNTDQSKKKSSTSVANNSTKDSSNSTKNVSEINKNGNTPLPEVEFSPTSLIRKVQSKDGENQNQFSPTDILHSESLSVPVGKPPFAKPSTYNWDRKAAVVGHSDKPDEQAPLKGAIENFQTAMDNIPNTPITPPLAKMGAKIASSNVQGVVEGLNEIATAEHHIANPKEMESNWQYLELPAALVKTGFSGMGLIDPKVMIFNAATDAIGEVLPSDFVPSVMSPFATILQKTGGKIPLGIGGEVKIFDIGNPDHLKSAAELTDLLYQILLFKGSTELATKLVHNIPFKPLEIKEVNEAASSALKDHVVPINKEVLDKIPDIVPDKMKVEVAPNIQAKLDIENKNKELERQKQELIASKQNVDENFHQDIDVEIEKLNNVIETNNTAIRGLNREVRTILDTETTAPKEVSEQSGSVSDVSNSVTFETAREGDVINHNGDDVTVISKGKSRGGNDIVTVKKEPVKKSKEELEMDAASQVWSRHRNEYGADGATVSEIKQNHNGEFNNVLSDLKAINDNAKPQEYTIDKEQWDNEVKAEGTPTETPKGNTDNVGGDVVGNFADAKNEYDAVKEKYNKHLKKDGGLRANTPENVKNEIDDAYQKVQSLVKKERERLVAEDKRDTGLVDGIERIRDNASAMNLVKLVMDRNIIPERQYNEFGKNLLHIVADAKDSHEVVMQTAEIIQDFTKRANVKIDDTVARELQSAENLKFEPVEQSISKPSTPTVQEGVETNKKVSLITKTKNYATDIIANRKKISRLSEQAEQGRIRGGSRNVEAAILLSTGGEQSGKIEGREAQQKAIEDYAKAEGIWYDNIEAEPTKGSEHTGLGTYIDSGVENKVYVPKENPLVVRKAMKTTDPFNKENPNEVLDHLDTRISEHNGGIGSSVPYTVVGFGRLSNGDFVVITEQPHIQDARLATELEIQTEMGKMGYEPDGKHSYGNENYYITDVNPKNVLVDKKGNLHFIDAIIDPIYEKNENGVQAEQSIKEQPKAETPKEVSNVSEQGGEVKTENNIPKDVSIGDENIVWEKKGIKGHTISANIGDYVVDVSRRFDSMRNLVGADLMIKKKNADGSFTVKKVISDYKTFSEAKKDALNKVNELSGVGLETLKVKKNEPNNVITKDRYNNAPDSEFEHGLTFMGNLDGKETVDQSKPFAVGYFGDNAANRYERAVASNNIADVIKRMKDFDSNEGAVEIYNPLTKEKKSFVLYTDNEYTNESVGLKQKTEQQKKDVSIEGKVDEVGSGDKVDEVSKGEELARVDSETLRTVPQEATNYVQGLDTSTDGYTNPRNRDAKNLMLTFPEKAALAMDISKFSERVFGESPLKKYPILEMMHHFYSDAHSVRDWANNAIKGLESDIKSNTDYIDSLKSKKKVGEKDKASIKMWEDSNKRREAEIEKVKSELDKWENETPKKSEVEIPVETVVKKVEGNLEESNDLPTKYNERVAHNLKQMDTPASEWDAVPISGFQETSNNKGVIVKMPTFEFPKGYNEAPTIYKGQNVCGLCGKEPIQNIYWLQNDAKKLTLPVGSECVTRFGEGKSGHDLARETRVEEAQSFADGIRSVRKTLLEENSFVNNIGYGRKERQWRNTENHKLYDLLKPFELPPEHGNSTYNKRFYKGDEARAKEAYEKDLLSWKTRNEKKYTDAIKSAGIELPKNEIANEKPLTQNTEQPTKEKSTEENKILSTTDTGNPRAKPNTTEPPKNEGENISGDRPQLTAKEKAQSKKEIAKAKLDEARLAFRKAGGLSSGGFESLPEFINLVKAYAEYGYESAKEAWKQFKEDFPEITVNQKIFEDEYNKHSPAESAKEITIAADEKSILKRLIESDNVSGKAKEIFKENGLKYEPHTHEEARAMAKSVIDEFGEDAAVVYAESGKLGGDINSAIFAEAIDRMATKEIAATDPKQKIRWAKKWADYAVRYDEAARSKGRFISQIYDFYKKSPLGIVLKAEKDFAKRADEVVEPRKKEVKEALNDLLGTPEFEAFIKDKVEDAIVKRKGTRKAKVDRFFDKLKIDTKGTMNAAIVPPQIWNGAVEVMRKAAHAGLSVAEIVERGVAHINSLNKDGWDEAQFRKDYQQKIASLEKETRFDLTDEQKKQVLEKWRKKLKGLNEEDRQFILSKAINHIVENGGLEYDDFKKMYADALGLPKMTDELRGKIMQLGKDINDADKAALEMQKSRTKESVKAYDLAVNKRDEASRGINDLLAKANHPFNTFLNLMRLNTLTPISMIANIGYNVGTLPIRTAINGIHMSMDFLSARVLGSKKPFTPLNSIGEYARGFKEGGVKSIRQFATGLTDKDYFQKEIKQNIKPIQSMRNLADFVQGKKKLQTRDIINNLLEASPLGIIAEAHARALNIGDKAFRYAEEYRMADIIAKEKGLSGVDAEIFKRLPDEDSKQRIVKAGERAILAQDNFASHMQDWIGKGVDSFVDKNPIWNAPMKAAKLAYTATQPYLKIPLNAAVFTFEMTMPEFTTAMGIAKAIKGDKTAALSYFAKATTGYAIRNVAMQMAQNGILIPQSQNDRERRGLSQYTSPFSMNYSAFRRWVLGGDVKAQDDDVVVSLTHFGALGLMLGTSAKVQQDKNENKKSEKQQTELDTYMNDVWSRLGYNAQAGFEQGVFNGTTSLTQGIFNGGWSGYLNSALSVTANAVEPSEIALLSRAIGRDTKPDLGAMSTVEKLSSNLQLRFFGGKNIPADVNMWGQDIKEIPEGRNKAAYYFFDMTKYSTIDKQQFGSNLADIYQRTSDERVFPSEPQPKITTDKKVVKLTPPQYHEYKKIVGEQRKNLTSALFSSELYKAADDEKKIELLNQQYDAGLNEGKALFELKYPSQFPSSTNNQNEGRGSRSTRDNSR